MNKVISSGHSMPIGIRLTFQKEECFDDEIYEVVFRDEKELVITSNGTYELKGSYRGEHTQLDISKFNKNLCIVGNNIVYGGANGDIFLIRMYLQRNHHIFSQKEILEGLFAVIDQIISLTDSSVVVLGIDKENKTKTVLLNINGDSMKVVMPRIHENVFIKYIIPSDETDFSLIVGRTNRNTRLFQFNAETYDKKVSIDLQENLEDKNPKMCIAFGNIIIAYGNTIISCTSEKVEYKQVIPTLHENEMICDMIQVEEYLIVFYKSTCFYLLNSELDIVGEMENLTENETLEKCYLLSNGKLCLLFSNEFQNSLRFFSYETYENVAPAVKSVKLSETAKSILKVYDDLAKCQPATPQEKAYSSKKFQEILKKAEPDNADIAILGIQNYVQSFGTELVLCKSSDTNNYTNRLHANLLFNGFLDTNPNYYCMEFEVNDLHFLNMKKSEETNAQFCEQFRNFISGNTKIPSDEIVITKIHNRNISFDFTFTQIDYHKLFNSKIDDFKTLINEDLDQFTFKKTKIKKVELHPILKECKLNVNMFNPEFDRKYDTPFTDIRGQLPYNPPLGWTRVALNIKYFGFSDDDDWIQMDKRRGEWAIAYHGIKEDPLGTAEKIINDESGKPTLKVGYRNLFCNAPNINDLDVEGYGKPCGVGIYCAPEITTAEMYAGEFVANNGKTTRLALMCRVNPYKVKIVETPYQGMLYYIVNESDNIRPYAILLKI